MVIEYYAAFAGTYVYGIVQTSTHTQWDVLDGTCNIFPPQTQTKLELSKKYMCTVWLYEYLIVSQKILKFFNIFGNNNI